MTTADTGTVATGATVTTGIAIMNGVKILGDGRIGENLDCLRGTLVAEVGHCALRQLVLSLVCRFLLGVGLALGIGGGLLLVFYRLRERQR